MVTLVSIIIAIKYLLCNTLPEEPAALPEQVSSIQWEPVVYDFQSEWSKDVDLLVHHQSADPIGSKELK
jgi:hypothetical protein